MLIISGAILRLIITRKLRKLTMPMICGLGHTNDLKIISGLESSAGDSNPVEEDSHGFCEFGARYFEALALGIIVYGE